MTAKLAYSVPRMSGGRILRAYLAETRIELLRILRSPEFLFPVVILPVAFYLLMGVAMRDMRAIGVANGRAMSDVAVYISFTVYAAMGVGLINIGTLLAVDRSYGLLAFKRALPMPPASYLVAKILVGVIFTLVIIAIQTALATWFGGVVLAPWRLLAIGGIMVLGIAPAAAIGLTVASYVSVSAASAIASILFIAMMMLGGLFYPLPGVLSTMRAIWPTYHLHQLGLAVAGAPASGSVWVHAGVLVVVTLVFTVLAARRLARAG